MLGVGFRKPMLTGFNSRSYNHLWHRGASCPPWPQPCGSDFAASSEPDPVQLYGGLIWLPGFRDRAADVRGVDGEYNATVVSLNNNAAVPLLFTALASHAEDRSYMACLQGQGALTPHPVCRYDRPLPTRIGPERPGSAERVPQFRGLWKANTIPAPPAPPAPAPRKRVYGSSENDVPLADDADTAGSSPDLTPVATDAPADGGDSTLTPVP